MLYKTRIFLCNYERYIGRGRQIGNPITLIRCSDNIVWRWLNALLKNMSNTKLK